VCNCAAKGDSTVITHQCMQGGRGPVRGTASLDSYTKALHGQGIHKGGTR
jgi:hypothetical protein